MLTPLANLILAEQAAQQLDSETYFNWVLLHEISHTLGPRTVETDGGEVTVSQALGEYYSPIEEGKADIGGLYNLPYLLEKGILTGSLESHYVGYLSEALRSVRFGTGSSYGMIRSSAWNYFVEQGALKYDPATRKFGVDVEKMTQAAESLVATLLTIEGEGDKEAAKAFLDKYMYVAPDLQALLTEADATVPVEFVPIYGKE